MQDPRRDISHTPIKPMPTEAELGKLAAWTQEWVFDDVIRFIPLRYSRTMFRRTWHSPEVQNFISDTRRTYGAVGVKVVSDTLQYVCDEHIAQQRALRALEKRRQIRRWRSCAAC